MEMCSDKEQIPASGVKYPPREALGFFIGAAPMKLLCGLSLRHCLNTFSLNKLRKYVISLIYFFPVIFLSILGN